MDERLGQEARELIDQALREEEQVDPSELARIRKRVLTVGVGVGTLGSAGKTLAVQGAGTAVGAVAIVKATLLGASAAVVAVGLSSLVTPRSAPRAPDPAPLVARSPALAPAVRGEHTEGMVTGTANVLPAELAAKSPTATSQSRTALPIAAPHSPPERAPDSTSVLPKPASDAPPATNGSDSSLLEEIALLERVQVALRAGNGAQALSLLDQSSAANGSGQLGSERLAAEVFAACQVGDRQRASRAARRFFRDYPKTPASDRVRASCAGEDSGQ